MAYNVGLNVVEVDGTATPAIVGAAVSVGAFNILTRRGIPHRPARVSSFQKFVEQFGGYFEGGLGAYLVKGFFDNGGQTAYVNRVAANDASSALLNLKNGAAANILELKAGFRGSQDPGHWGDTLFAAVAASSSSSSRLRETAPATVTGSALTAPVDMSTLPPITLRVDGDTHDLVITFQAGDFPGGAASATLQQIVDAINARGNGRVTASVSASKISLASTGALARLNQAFSQIQITQPNATLGLAVTVSPVLGTPAARTQTSSTLAQVSDFKVGDAIRITDGTGPNTAVVKLMAADPLTGNIQWAPAIAGIAGYTATSIVVSKVEFDLSISYGSIDNVVETWRGLSMERDVANYAVSRLNDALQGSRFVVAKDLSAAAVPGPVLAVAAAAQFSPGSDGTPTLVDFVGDSANHKGFYAFDTFDVQLVTCERSDWGITKAGIDYCAAREDCMYVGAAPQGSVAAGQAVAYGKTLQGKKVYGALYAPWIIVTDPAGIGDNPRKLLPPVGHVMGVYARIESTRGIWKAPAGDEANLAGVLDVETRISDVDHTDLVKNGSVNGIRAIPGAGIVVDASRTLSTDTRWLYVNVRLLFNYVKSSLRQGLRWVRQEPNRDTLWNAVKFGTVNPFLTGLWRQGAFGTGSASEVFKVICDASNNPPDEVDKGNFKVEVYFYPSKPAETIIIIVGQQPSGAKAAEP